MRRRWLECLAGVALAVAAGRASAAADAAARHATIRAYEGTRTCGACHPKQVKDFVKSLHYQHQAPAPYLANAQQGKSAGMMVSY